MHPGSVLAAEELGETGASRGEVGTGTNGDRRDNTIRGSSGNVNMDNKEDSCEAGSAPGWKFTGVAVNIASAGELSRVFCGDDREGLGTVSWGPSPSVAVAEAEGGFKSFAESDRTVKRTKLSKGLGLLKEYGQCTMRVGVLQSLAMLSGCWLTALLTLLRCKVKTLSTLPTEDSILLAKLLRG